MNRAAALIVLLTWAVAPLPLGARQDSGATAAQRATVSRTVNLLQTGQQYGKGMHQLDVCLAAGSHGQPRKL